MRRAAAVLALAVLAGGAGAAARNDLRDFRVGMPVEAMTLHGYAGLFCVAAPSVALGSWGEWARCPADAQGRHAVGFVYDNADNALARVSEDGQGTKVAGQPVLPSLLIASGRLEGLRIATDPKQPLFVRRRADVFGLQARARYGGEGWRCEDRPPGADRQPIGDVFVDQHCEKDADGRHYEVERALYRDPARPLRDFTSSAQVTILAGAAP